MLFLVVLSGWKFPFFDLDRSMGEIMKIKQYVGMGAGLSILLGVSVAQNDFVSESYDLAPGENQNITAMCEGPTGVSSGGYKAYAIDDEGRALTGSGCVEIAESYPVVLATGQGWSVTFRNPNNSGCPIVRVITIAHCKAQDAPSS